MDIQTATIEKVCSARGDIGAYIDGELPPCAELELEMHLAVCAECSGELNEQKKLLRVLDLALENENEFEMPANFTRVIVASAESRVSGLRRPQERFNALFVCAALFLLIILGLGGEMKTVLYTFVKFADQFLAVGGFACNLIYDIAVGMAVILRSLSHRVIFHSSASITALIGFFGMLLLVFSRVALRSARP